MSEGNVRIGIRSEPVKITKWQPWEDFDPAKPLPIAAPPCPSCTHWKPVRIFSEFLVLVKPEAVLLKAYEGVRLCHSTQMERDFSCFDAGEH